MAKALSVDLRERVVRAVLAGASCRAAAARFGGRSPLAEAIRYTLTRWEGLICFLDDGRIELDTNPVERSIQPIADVGSLCPSSSSI